MSSIFTNYPGRSHEIKAVNFLRFHSKKKLDMSRFSRDFMNDFELLRYEAKYQITDAYGSRNYKTSISYALPMRPR